MRIIDLSQPIHDNMPVYPGDGAARLYPYRTLQKNGYFALYWETGLHVGTHVDMPGHLTGDTRLIDDLPPDHFCGRGVLIDVRGQEKIMPTDDIRSRLYAKDVVIFWTGHDVRYGSSEYYTRHPVISKEMADALIDAQIKMLGFDMPSPDYMPFDIHKLLLYEDILLIENLTNLKELEDLDEFFLMALPLHIAAEASPCRAVAVIP